MNKHMRNRLAVLAGLGIKVTGMEDRAGAHVRLDVRLPDGREAFMFTSINEASHDSWTRWKVVAKRLAEGQAVKGVTLKRESGA